MDPFLKIIICTIFVSCYIMVYQLISAMYATDSEPRQKIDATGLGLKFEGNTSVPDHFKLLERDGDFLLIGARDIVYNISVNTFVAQTHIVWQSSEEDVQLCLMKGKSKSDCHNYVRILAKQNGNDLLICGTNSYNPKCRQYTLQNDKYADIKEFSGSGICPYDPVHNSTAFYSKEKNELYAGTVADFAGADPLVSKRQIDEPDDLGLRTERSDTKCLNDPNFVSSFNDSDHVYFWFREGAVEHTNCGKAVHSRVSRVCKNDKGGPRANADTWTTFLKASLNCSIPGDYPFYFDEIEATSGVVNSKSHNGGGVGEDVELVYAVFSTPYNSIRASAVCAFSMQAVRNIFANSAYKAQASPNSNWLPIFRSQVPQPRPGDCDSDSRLLSEEAVNFVKKNPLMDDQVPNFFNSPLLVQFGFKQGVRFTQIAVDAQVTSATAGIQKFDVIFVGTDNGHVIKLVNLISRTIQIEIVNVFADGSPVINMLIYRPGNSDDAAYHREARLIVVGDETIKSLPLHYCDAQANSCAQCVYLQDPYCAWDTISRKCVGITNGNWSKGSFVQNVKTGDPMDYCNGERSGDIFNFSIKFSGEITEKYDCCGEITYFSPRTAESCQYSSATKNVENNEIENDIKWINDQPIENSEFTIPSQSAGHVIKNLTAQQSMDDLISCDCSKRSNLALTGHLEEYAGKPAAEKSSINDGAPPAVYSYSTPVQYSSTAFYVSIIAASCLTFLLGTVAGYFLLPKCRKLKKVKGQTKLSTETTTVVKQSKIYPDFPNGSLTNTGHVTNGGSHAIGGSRGSTSPLNPVKNNGEVTVAYVPDAPDPGDLYNEGAPRSSTPRHNGPAKNQPYSSHTLPKARQTYL